MRARVRPIGPSQRSEKLPGDHAAVARPIDITSIGGEGK